LVVVPPFTAILHRTSDRDWFNFALVTQVPGRGRVGPAVRELQRAFQERSRKLKIEFNEEVWPDLAAQLESAGLELRELNPLMACEPAQLRPVEAEGVAIRLLGAGDPDAELADFMAIRFTDGTMQPPPTPERVAEQRDWLERGWGRYALASVGAEAAGTGVLHAHEGVGEIVGVVTRPEFRRRGVAATVTTFLCRLHFQAGGRLAFLDSANPEASRVYERLGFQRFGALRVYV